MVSSRRVTESDLPGPITANKALQQTRTSRAAELSRYAKKCSIVNAWPRQSEDKGWKRTCI